MENTNNLGNFNDNRKKIVRLDSSVFQKDYEIDFENGGIEATKKEIDTDLHGEIVSNRILGGVAAIDGLVGTYISTVNPRSKDSAIAITVLCAACLVRLLFRIRKLKRAKRGMGMLLDRIDEDIKNNSK